MQRIMTEPGEYLWPLSTSAGRALRRGSARSGRPAAPARLLACSRPRTMADRTDIDFSYTLTDRAIRLSLGDLADFSGAKYDGDFSLTLEQAQRRKHDYIAEQIGIGPGRLILDLGFGWDGKLLDIRSMLGSCLGETSYEAEEASCRRTGR